MLYLKQSTASQSVLIGPFVDATDGVTAETGLTIANTDIRLSKNGGNMAAKNLGGGTHDEEGYYTITLDATDTNTVGVLQLSVQDAAHLPVYHEFQVLEEATYDFLFASGATPIADINAEVDTGISDAALATAAALATVDSNVDAILLDTAEIGAAGAGLTEAGGTGDHLTAVPYNAAWDAEIQSEVTDALNAYDPPTRAELTSDIAGLNDPTAAAIADQVWDEPKAGHVAAGSFGEEVQAHALSTEVSGLNDLSAAEVNAEVDTALADYDPPTRAELTSDIGTVTTAITALNDLAASDILTTQLTEAYAAAGTVPTLVQLLFEVRAMLTEAAAAGTTLTTKRVDGSTTAGTYTLDDGTNPTSITRAT